MNSESSPDLLDCDSRSRCNKSTLRLKTRIAVSPDALLRLRLDDRRRRDDLQDLDIRPQFDDRLAPHPELLLIAGTKIS
jgi:hypothetical protein